jgi:hypothetical protein
MWKVPQLCEEPDAIEGHWRLQMQGLTHESSSQYLPTSWVLKRGRPLDIGVLYTGQPWVCDENEAGSHSTVELWAAAKLPTGVCLRRSSTRRPSLLRDFVMARLPLVVCCNSTAIVEIFVLTFVAQVSFCGVFLLKDFYSKWGFVCKKGIGKERW